MEGATIDSPRGKWTMSKSHNPVQDIYVRQVSNKENKVIGVGAKAALAARWCDPHGRSQRANSLYVQASEPQALRAVQIRAGGFGAAALSLEGAAASADWQSQSVAPA